MVSQKVCEVLELGRSALPFGSENSRDLSQPLVGALDRPDRCNCAQKITTKSVFHCLRKSLNNHKYFSLLSKIYMCKTLTSLAFVRLANPLAILFLWQNVSLTFRPNYRDNAERNDLKTFNQELNVLSSLFRFPRCIRISLS